MATVGENNKMLKNEPLMMTHTLYHSTLEGARLQERSMCILQELQQKTDNIEMGEKLGVTEVDNNILKFQLQKIKQKMKLQVDLHKQETLAQNN
jgi:hypothetical protein